MINDFQKYSRGQIWEVDAVCTVLVLGGADVSTVVAPVSATTHTDSYAHIVFEGPDGPRTILCEQLQLMTYEQFTSYIGSVSDRVMAQVEDALSRLLHIGKQVEQAKPAEPVVPAEQHHSPLQRKISRTWTEKDKREFVKDYETMSSMGLIKKWDVPPGSLRAYRNKFQKELNGDSVLQRNYVWDTENMLAFLAEARVTPTKIMADKWELSQSSVNTYVTRFKDRLGIARA